MKRYNFDPRTGSYAIDHSSVSLKGLHAGWNPHDSMRQEGEKMMRNNSYHGRQLGGIGGNGLSLPPKSEGNLKELNRMFNPTMADIRSSTNSFQQGIHKVPASMKKSAKGQSGVVSHYAGDAARRRALGF